MSVRVSSFIDRSLHQRLTDSENYSHHHSHTNIDNRPVALITDLKDNPHYYCSILPNIPCRHLALLRRFSNDDGNGSDIVEDEDDFMYLWMDAVPRDLSCGESTCSPSP